MSGQGTLPTGGGYGGAAWQQTAGQSINAIDFLVRRIIAGKAFSALVKVIKVDGGALDGPATVAVQIMVNQINPLTGVQVPHGTVYNLPCFRLQGQYGAVVLDPAVGEIGQAICCDRDISNVKATGDISGPGSWRMNDWADGCYFGSFLGGIPHQYVQFFETGVNIVDVNGNVIAMAPGGITITSVGTLTVDAANSQFNGNINATGTISP